MGLGIVWAAAHRIFDPQPLEQVGLGLALSRRFVEMHGGTIRVESELGKGSVFVVVMPRMQTGRTPDAGAARSSVLFAAPTGMLGGQASSGLEFGVSHRF